MNFSENLCPKIGNESRTVTIALQRFWAELQLKFFALAKCSWKKFLTEISSQIQIGPKFKLTVSFGSNSYTWPKYTYSTCPTLIEKSVSNREICSILTSKVLISLGRKCPLINESSANCPYMNWSGQRCELAQSPPELALDGRLILKFPKNKSVSAGKLKSHAIQRKIRQSVRKLKSKHNCS